MFIHTFKKVSNFISNLLSFKKFLKENGITKRKFIGFENKPSYMVILECMKETNEKLTSLEWFELVNSYEGTLFYGNMPISTVRAGLCKLHNKGLIHKEKASKVRYFINV